jgi:hypothetical protein
MFNTAEDRPTTSKLVLYIAGTGKTLSPLGLSETTIIYVR